ncbi:Modification methylase FokI [bioreactor metagenome]|uniref:site-specific DNA-methyltransferase (adenine-specific) n=1 Tax=bioreactor metagenome TaxID=1076179 RepID=A0A644Y5V8_9ZZZZ
MLYTLIVFGFNNQIRFNKQGNYNIPVGKRDFNSKIKSNLIIFLKNIKDSDSEFINVNFKCLTANDFIGSFVYADPPYLITNASYNEQGGWAEDCEYKLYELLDSLNRNNINFALSNVIENKGTKNTILESWITNNDYKIHYLDMSYNNSNYQIKDRSNKTVEVLITNY